MPPVHKDKFSLEWRRAQDRAYSRLMPHERALVEEAQQQAIFAVDALGIEETLSRADALEIVAALGVVLGTGRNWKENIT